MSILIIGVYLAGQANNAVHLVKSFYKSKNWNTIQKWASIGPCSENDELKEVTKFVSEEGKQKFVILNKLLADEDIDKYDFIIVSDDDISVPDGFIDDYLNLIMQYDFALAQPARTHQSYIDHHFTEQLAGLKARRTRFVEIGPLFSIRNDIFSSFLPFDEDAYMGWGCDFVWPCIIDDLSLKMGIIDSTPVDHSLRKPVGNYNYDIAKKSFDDYLSKHSHLTKVESFIILESYV